MLAPNCQASAVWALAVGGIRTAVTHRVIAAVRFIAYIFNGWPHFAKAKFRRGPSFANCAIRTRN